MVQQGRSIRPAATILFNTKKLRIMYLLAITTKNGVKKLAKTKSLKCIDTRLLNVPYTFVLRHKADPRIKPMYYGPNGIVPGSKEAASVSLFLKQYGNNTLVAWLGAKIEAYGNVTYDGRGRNIKSIPYYSIDMLIC